MSERSDDLGIIIKQLDEIIELLNKILEAMKEDRPKRHQFFTKIEKWISFQPLKRT